MKECGKPAVAVYVWPTMKTIPCCEQHANQARGVAQAMGFTLGVLPIVGETCTQQVQDGGKDQ